MQIRSFKPGDTDQIARLFHNTVREVNLGDYTADQVKAWAPGEIHFKDWEAFCLTKHTFVAEEEGTICGFAQLEENGYIDCFYCHKDYQRKGVGSLLFKALLNKAAELKLNELVTESSITARPFFEDKGFVSITSQKVAKGNQVLINFRMKKVL